MKRHMFSTSVKRFCEELWHFHFVVPDEVVQYYKDRNIKRVICHLDDSFKIHSGLMPAGEGIYFINLNKQILKKLNKWEHDQLKVEMWEDTSEYGMPMPEELREAMNADPDGDKYFHELTPGKQRSLIYIVDKLKSIDKRIEKSIIILNHLTANQGKLDYKALNEAFKQGLDWTEL